MPANVTNSINFHRGDVAAGFAEADAIVEGSYTFTYVHQGYMETQTCPVAPNPVNGGRDGLHQHPGVFYTRDEVAAALGLPAPGALRSDDDRRRLRREVCADRPFVASLAVKCIARCASPTPAPRTSWPPTPRR